MTMMPKGTAVPAKADDLCSKPAAGEARDVNGGVRDIVWQVPEEVPVALQLNSEPLAVMMATPADIRDFAIGFAIGEGLIRNAGAIKGVLVMPADGGITADLAVDPSALNTARLTKRAMEGRTGCGLCGVEEIADALKPLPVLKSRQKPATAAVLKAANALPQHQPMNKLNRTVHGAAWVSPSGDILLVREDVGRHNALDKLIGALAVSKTDLSQGFVLMTSRCSFELVQKAAFAGVSALVTVSAPTALALELAKKANMFLGSLAGSEIAVFNCSAP